MNITPSTHPTLQQTPPRDFPLLSLPKDVLFLIMQFAQTRPYHPFSSPLPLVSRGFRHLCEQFMDINILPKLLKIPVVATPTISATSVLDKCGQISHRMTRRLLPLTQILLKNLQAPEETYAPLVNEWTSLLRGGVNCNFLTLNHTPLLHVCNYSIRVFSSFYLTNTAQQQLIEPRLLQLVDTLLIYGADPNLQGYPSTPLMTILMIPSTPEGMVFIEKVAQRLLEKGANPHLLPQKDIFGNNKTPLQFVETRLPSLVPLFAPYKERHTLAQLVDNIFSKVMWRKKL